MKGFESFTLLLGLLSFRGFKINKKKPCIKQVFDQDSSTQPPPPPSLFGFSNPLDEDFHMWAIAKTGKWKIDHKRRVRTAEPCQHSNLAALKKSYPFLPFRPNSWLQDFSFLSCLSLWLNASPLCQPHILKNVLGVLPSGIYLKLSFLLNLGALGWSRKRSAKLNMTNKLKIFIRRQQPYVLPLSCLPVQSLLPFAGNVRSCSPPFKYTYMRHGVMDKFFDTSWLFFFVTANWMENLFVWGRKEKICPSVCQLDFALFLCTKVVMWKRKKRKKNTEKNRRLSLQKGLDKDGHVAC